MSLLWEMTAVHQVSLRFCWLLCFSRKNLKKYLQKLSTFLGTMSAAFIMHFNSPSTKGFEGAGISWEDIASSHCSIMHIICKYRSLLFQQPFYFTQFIFMHVPGKCVILDTKAWHIISLNAVCFGNTTWKCFIKALAETFLGWKISYTTVFSAGSTTADCSHLGLHSPLSLFPHRDK